MKGYSLSDTFHAGITKFAVGFLAAKAASARRARTSFSGPALTCIQEYAIIARLSVLVATSVRETARKVMRALAAVGHGIFAIGYTIGTGSVTSMAKADADYGLGLLWVLSLSCLFSGVLMSAYGRFAAVTGETALHGMVRFSWSDATRFSSSYRSFSSSCVNSCRPRCQDS